MFTISEQENPRLEGGTWAEYNGGEFLIAHAGSLRFQRALSRLQKPHRRKMEKGEMDPADSRKLLIQALAEAILLDWKGVKNSAGEDVAYSVKSAITALTNDPAFREFVMEFSAEMENFRKEEAEYEGNT